MSPAVKAAAREQGVDVSRVYRSRTLCNFLEPLRILWMVERGGGTMTVWARGSSARYGVSAGNLEDLSKSVY